MDRASHLSSAKRRDFSKERRYSSSDGEDIPNNCMNKGGIKQTCENMSHGRKRWTPDPAQPEQGQSYRGHYLTEKSPTQTSENPGNRLYSYLSGSEGEGEVDPSSQVMWERRKNSPSPSCSSISANGSSASCSPSDSPCDHERLAMTGSHDPTTDTMDSSGVGENVYSRIRDTGLMALPVIPPPPPTESVPGPAVPPRHNSNKMKMMNTSSTQTLERRPRRSALYTEQQQLQDSHFLLHTTSGNVLVPSGDAAVPVVPTFPRTVPRTISLPRDSQQNRQSITDGSFAVPPTIMQNALSMPNSESNTSVTAGQVLPTTQNRTLDEARYNVAIERQNVTFNPNASLLPTLPTYPSIRNDFRDYSNFNSTSYQVKKHLVCSRTWKCLSLVLMFVIILLTAIVSYLLAMKVYNLSWRLNTEVYLTDAYQPNVSLSKSKDSKSIDSSAIIQYQLSQTIQHDIPSFDFLRTSFYVSNPCHVIFNVSVPRGAFIGIYGRRNAYPTHAQYDFFHAVDGEKLVKTSKRYERAAEKPVDLKTKDSTFVRFIRSGVWYVFVYNDGQKPLRTTFMCTYQTTANGNCPLDCRGRGECHDGICHCFPGYDGPDCDHEVCPVLCMGNGLYQLGSCKCYRGWTGGECQLVSTNCPDPTCEGHGKCVDGECVCAAGYAGHDCSIEVCEGGCFHGYCKNQRCRCENGWSGVRCDLVGCDQRCDLHGVCNNGSCVCQPGWNGRHCTLDGCTENCNNHGSCQLFHIEWMCNCRDGWKGLSCNVAMEMDCENNMDEDRDGLTDCQDPDCCISISCRESVLCSTAPDPMEILLRKQPSSSSASFYDRMRFLIEDESVQSYATISSFNQTQVSVIRGKVISSDGSPLIGVRVTVVTQPLYGFTLTREQGLFDMLVNGGGSVTLNFQRVPFLLKKVTVMVSWNRMITMDDVVLTLDGKDDVPSMDKCAHFQHDYYNMKPMVLSTWEITQLGTCPSKTAIISESQVLQESLQIPGTSVYLVHHSRTTSGYMSTIMIMMTGQHIPPDLIMIRLRILVEGLIYERIFEADHQLKYRFAWDRRNAYNQKVYGLVTAIVQVGYQYRGCRQLFWEIQSATINSYDMSSSDIGGWNLNIHHIYNFQEGVLYKGDGNNIYLKKRPRRVIVVLGNGRTRRIDCKGCDGKTEDNRLLAPVALACGRDGSLYIGDYNFIRKLSSAREEAASILQLSMPEVVYKYYMTVSPVDGRLYISDHQRLRISRVKTMGTVRDLAQNSEVIAGTGEQCIPGDIEKCGDGGPALNAKLFYPKGIAISKDGLVYIADGNNIRTIDDFGNIQTVIGSQDVPRHWLPLPCHQVANADEVTLHWPTAIAINPLDDTLYILDNNLILKVTQDRKVLIVAGHSLHCPPRNASFASISNDAGSMLAIDSLLEHPQHISFSPDGDLYIVESNGKSVNRVRVVDTSGRIQHYAGSRSKCDCQQEVKCKCNVMKDDLAANMVLDNPTSIVVTPDGTVHVSDMGTLRVYSIVSSEPTPDRLGQVEVTDPHAQEVYVFNRYGLHIATKSRIIDQILYNFTYDVNSYYGKLTKITDSGGNMLSLRRDYKLLVKDIFAPGGYKAKLTMDVMGQLQAFISVDNVTTRFSYLGNTGLLESRETSDRRMFLYEYDDIGRLSAVVMPTGERSIIMTDIDTSGVLVMIADENVASVSMSTNGNCLTIIQDELHTIVSQPYDGVLVATYPNSTTLRLERSPSLLSTNNNYQSHLKCRVQRLNNVTYDAEWLYSAPVDSSQTTISIVSRKLQIGSETLLTFEYDQNTNTETVKNRNQDRVLSVQYDKSGRPVHIIPVGPVEGLNITYDQHGRLAGWNRGDMNVVNVFDERTGDLVEKKLANRVFYRYIYKNGNKATDVILPSGKQYQLHYDDFGNLKAITMPNLSRHYFHSLMSIGIHRKIYRPAGSHGMYIQDYNAAGQLLQVLYPSNHRRATYFYSNNGNHMTVYADWMNSVYEYDPASRRLLTSNVFDLSSGYGCTLTSQLIDGLPVKQSISFNNNSQRLINATFRYDYDNHYRLTSTDVIIGTKSLKSVQYNYSDETGRIVKMLSFIFEYPRIHREIIKDANVEITREFDRYYRVADVWYRFNTYVVFTLEVKYDSLNRIHQWRRKIGSSDLKAYEYLYDIDGNVIEVLVSGQSTWKYEMDANNNIVRMSYYGNSRNVIINQRDQVESSGQESYVYDQDGFLAQRNRETYQYDSFGRLVRAFETNRYDIRYFYDSLRRLIGRKDESNGLLLQFFYSDPKHENRVTHVIEQQSKRITELFYDDRGRLFAMKLDADYFYIALDPNNSPIVILNSVGSVVKQIEYDPLGSEISDSAPDFVFHFGFQGAIVDRTTHLIFIKSRVYDPKIGRWAVPSYDSFLDSISKVASFPEMSNLYRNVFLWKRSLDKNDLLTDMSIWLDKLNYDTKNLLPEMLTTFNLQLLSTGNTIHRNERLISVTTAFDCVFRQSIARFLQLSAVQQSKIINQDNNNNHQTTFSLLAQIFGRGVVLNIRNGKVTVNIMESANEALGLLATTLFNNSDAVDLRFTVHGRDMHFFVKPQMDEAGENARLDGVIQGLNVSVHRHKEQSDRMQLIDIHLQRNHTAINLRYGTTVTQEYDRILYHAHQRAMEGAWIIERELVQSNKLSLNSWTKSQREELLSKGYVEGMRAEYLRSVKEFPEMADDPRNIRFVRPAKS